MNRGVKLLLWLYPPRWRKRYGAEFGALIEDIEPSAYDTFDIFCGAIKMQITTWSFGRITLACALLGLLAATVAYVALPPRYQSDAVIMAVPPGEPAKVAALNELANHLLSADSLTPLIKEHSLYGGTGQGSSLADALQKMQKSIRIDPLPTGSHSPENLDGLIIRFDYPDPRVAQQVSAELTSRLVGDNLKMAALGNFRLTLYLLKPSSLPSKPIAPNPARLGAEGLFAGLIAGLAFASIAACRRTPTLG